MGKGLVRSLSRGNPQLQEVLKQTFVAKDLALTLNGATGVGFGSAIIGDLPEGNILILGASSYLSFAGSGADAGLSDTWAGDYGVGSIPTSDANLTTLGDDDFVPSTPLAAATAEVSPRTRGVSTAVESGVVLDNTDNSLEINISLLVDDADVSADAIPILVNGEVTIAYIMLGDD